MAMDIRLTKASDMLCTMAFDYGIDSEEYKAASLEYLEAFKVVAADRGESVIAWENPYDHIMEAIDGYVKAATIENAISEFKVLVDALESIGYKNLDKWKDNYEECVAAWAATEK